jgi:hypothetical protein
MEIVIALVVLAVAVVLIVGPLRGGRGPADSPGPPAHAELEAAKEAKYREIRDAELDYRTGKLSQEDWERLDSSLRAEAVALLDRLEGLEGLERGGEESAELDSDEA